MRFNSSSSRRVWLGAAAVLVAASGLPGCGGDEDAQARIVKARATLASLGASGTAAPSASRSKAYEQVIASMQGIGAGAGSSVTGAAAKLISAQAMLGQGVILGEAQRVDESSVTRLAEAVRVKAELFVKFESLAASLEGHDVSKSVGALQGEISKLGEAMESARGREAAAVEGLEKLRATGEEMLALARVKRDEAGQLRAALESASGEARLAVVQEAAKRQREADVLESDYAKVELGVQELERQRGEIALEIGRLRRQTELAQASIAREQSSAALLKEQSGAARASASEVGREIGAALEALAQEIEQKLKVSYEAAKGKYESASSSASGGSAADSALSKALSGAAQQALAALHAGYAGAMANAVDAAGRVGVLRGVASAEQARALAGAWMEEVKSARDAAASASAQAGASFQGANPKGPGAEILRRLGERLQPAVAPEGSTEGAGGGEGAGGEGVEGSSGDGVESGAEPVEDGASSEETAGSPAEGSGAGAPGAG